MTLTAYILGIVAALITLAVVVEMMRRKRMRERHAIWWLLAGLLALIIGIFPGILAWAANLLGVGAPVNLVFFVSIAVLFLVCIQHSTELTTLEDKTRSLAEEVVLLRLRLNELEARVPTDEQTASPHAADRAAPPAE
jgi:hypothetical protein